MTATTSPRYLTVTETAKHLRKALKKSFPGVKFSVRSKSYSGGASITVSWTDGPTEETVSEVSDAFSGASFDGMIDLKSYHNSTLTLEDGSEELVHHGADFVFTSRSYSDRVEAEAYESLRAFANEALYVSEGAVDSLDSVDLTEAYLRVNVVRARDSDDGVPHWSIGIQPEQGCVLVHRYLTGKVL